MVDLRNKDPESFREYIKNKQVVVFGAGKALDSCLSIYFEDKEIEFIVDSNEKVWDTEYKFQDNIYAIKSPGELIELYQNNKEVICFISTPFYAVEIVEQLDSINELDGMECYLSIIMRNTYGKIDQWDFTDGPQLIPKMIHYIWIGDNALPNEFKKNIETWKQFNPDYKIIRWDESNLDFDDCDYIREAYKERKWAFVSNYCRLKVIYENGGIYLDTDVEGLANFDRLLNDEAFFNMGCADRINNGCGFGAVKGNEFVKALIEEYKNIKKSDNKQINTNIQGHIILNRIAKSRGFKIENQYQRNKFHEVIYPSEVMSPYYNREEHCFPPCALSVHKENGSWKTTKEKMGIKGIKLLLKRLNVQNENNSILFTAIS